MKSSRAISRVIRSLMMMIEMVLETLVQYRRLKRLTAREDFIEFSRRESSEHMPSSAYS